MITILVIDNDASLRMMAERVLERAGFTVIPAADVGTALRRLEVLKVDLVICESGLPGQRGATAFDDITEVDPTARILMLVAKHQEHPAGLPGAAETLGKPFTPSELLGAVRRSIARHLANT